MQDQPLVSIIIPTYNRAHLIGETLDSVLAQTYTNWECIVVDDGSTDGTSELMEVYCAKDSRFQYHHRPKDRLPGGNAARNYGFELCKGEYVNWFDSDDLMHSDKLLIQVKAMTSSSRNFSVCQTLVFEGDISNVIGLRHEHIISEDPLLDFVKGKIVFLTQSPLIKNSFLTKFNLRFSEDLRAAQEWEFFTRVLFHSPRYHTTEEPLVLIRKHNSSITYYENNDLRIWHYYLAREKLFFFLKDKKTNNLQEINSFLNFYFKSRLKTYLFEKKKKESWIIFNNTLVFLYDYPKRYLIKLYIKFVLLTGRGYNYFNKYIS